MNFKKFRKFKKNAKALSPVIATIILIAVTVAVSVVVAAWMGALTIGFMGNSEQASITNIQLSSTGTVGTAVISVQNTGAATVTITSAYIDSNPASITAAVNSAGGSVLANGQVTILKGTAVTITITGAAFTNTAEYTIKLMTGKGNTVSNQATYTGS
jgi:flagellin-like protein